MLFLFGDGLSPFNCFCEIDTVMHDTCAEIFKKKKSNVFTISISDFAQFPLLGPFNMVFLMMLPQIFFCGHSLVFIYWKH